MKPILQTSVLEEDAILRKESVLVPDDLFGGSELDTMLQEMAEVLDATPNGVALAAPQIGLLWRIFIVRYDRMLSPSEEDENPNPPPMVGVYINPSIVRTSKRKLEMDEGCLSVSTHFGKTVRFDRATVRAQDARGQWFERGAGGILAQAFQHEIDHLNGMLFIDHATNVITTEEHRARTTLDDA